MVALFSKFYSKIWVDFCLNPNMPGRGGRIVGGGGGGGGAGGGGGGGIEPPPPPPVLPSPVVFQKMYRLKRG